MKLLFILFCLSSVGVALDIMGYMTAGFAFGNLLKEDVSGIARDHNNVNKLVDKYAQFSNPYRGITFITLLDANKTKRTFDTTFETTGYMLVHEMKAVSMQCETSINIANCKTNESTAVMTAAIFLADGQKEDIKVQMEMYDDKGSAKFKKVHIIQAKAKHA